MLIGAAIGAAIGFGADLYNQLHQNGGNWDCVDWGEVARWTGVGALAGLTIGMLWPMIVASPDSLLDIGFMAYDAATGNWSAFVWDAAGLLLPGVTRLGRIDDFGRAASHLDDLDNFRYLDDYDALLRNAGDLGKDSANALVRSRTADINYYVRPNGEAIPATAYRYSAGSAFYDSVAHGIIPPGQNGTYFFFNYFAEATTAKASLQIPYSK